MWIPKVSSYEMGALVPEVGTHSLRGDIFKHILKCHKIILWHSVLQVKTCRTECSWNK